MIYEIISLIFAIFAIMNIFRLYTHSLNISAADENFFNGGWKGWQFASIQFSNFDQVKKEFIERLNLLKQNKFYSSLELLDYTKDTDTDFNIYNQIFKSPPNYNDVLKIVISDKYRTINMLANHGFCDGLRLYEILGTILNYNNKLIPIKYFRYPFVSECMVIEYLFRHFIKSLNYIPISVHENPIISGNLDCRIL
jgi:hypothetical protein